MKVTITRGSLQLTLDECSATELADVLRALPPEAPAFTWPVTPTIPHVPTIHWQPATHPWYDPGVVYLKTITTSDNTLTS